ncbi:MAG: PTS sugar transporter subunit IIA [Planctomycetaceae bacterium]|nr:PTS sugar transporter subunit IIA [Planctomycetaceae bacterium]MCB9941167.1 PTS sugar transporter subunit IIA [Planctomycetaceae bacterium]HRX81677.1 PTS sugar transporter subunit IIA [Pirellulaceae bacterium]
MAHEDFDIDSLAVYLHLTPPQVAKMADRGNLPGRKVGGHWRFAQAEIHHWLEERIGASGESELIEVEGVLQSAAEKTSDEVIAIASMLPLEAIEVPLSARTRNSVVNSMVGLAARTGLLWDPEKMAEAVRLRETLHPTALDNGVALLHPRRPMPTVLAEPVLALGRTSSGIPFGGPRGMLTDIFFLICSIDDRGHLRTLARLSRLVGDPEFLTALRESATPAATRDCFMEFESRIPR